ncbi:MAG TPA: response regulator [Cytophagaceae bacterium]|nr:response regulator [Cytophagaceae bacterium]
MNSTSIHLLLADDDEDDCLFFQEALDELALDIKFKAVHNGEQLIQYLQEATELPTVLFLDVNMPRKNGLEALKEIKQQERLMHLPVIIYSTSFDIETINALYIHGAQFYIRKPTDFKKLKQLIHHALDQVLEAYGMQPPRERFVL